jgi:hypothetical protein
MTPASAAWPTGAIFRLSFGMRRGLSTIPGDVLCRCVPSPSKANSRKPTHPPINGLTLCGNVRVCNTGCCRTNRRQRCVNRRPSRRARFVAFFHRHDRSRSRKAIRERALAAGARNEKLTSQPAVTRGMRHIENDLSKSPAWGIPFCSLQGNLSVDSRADAGNQFLAIGKVGRRHSERSLLAPT